MLLGIQGDLEVCSGSGEVRDSPRLNVGPSFQEKYSLLGQEGFFCLAQGPHVGPYVGFPGQASGDRGLKTKPVLR